MTDESFSDFGESSSESSEETRKPKAPKRTPQKKNPLKRITPRKVPKKMVPKKIAQKRKLDEDMDNYNDKDPRKNQKEIYVVINMQIPPLQKIPKPNLEKEKKSEDEEKNDEEKSDEEEKEGPELPSEKTDLNITFEKTFDNLQELIELGEKYDPSFNYICNLNIQKLHGMTESLRELDTMIGLDKFKKSIVDQVVYLLTLNLERKSEKPMLHTCIYGPPGAGKSQISSILAKIYASCGFLSTDQFKVVKREDFVAEYLGQTAVKTKQLLENSLGKVLFLDEAYSMGSSENRDYFAKEAIDTINVFLSENYHNFILIIAGYEDQLNKCFFAQNPGLSRRFPYRFTIDGYNYQELCLIFEKMVKDEGWELTADNLNGFFREHKDSFPYYGGDVKTLLDKCKIVHTKQLMILDKSRWKKLTNDDIREGFILYLEERQVKKKDDFIHNMYL